MIHIPGTDTYVSIFAVAVMLLLLLVLVSFVVLVIRVVSSFFRSKNE